MQYKILVAELHFSFSMASQICSQLAQKGDLEGLKIARQNGWPWDEATCSGAALNGHLHVLQWARQNGCPWGEETCTAATQKGHLHVLQWARQNGCPWDENGIKSHLQNSSYQLLNFYGPHRWLERELNISWSSSVVQWMDATDAALDGILISDLSHLIKKYV